MVAGRTVCDVPCCAFFCGQHFGLAIKLGLPERAFRLGHVVVDVSDSSVRSVDPLDINFKLESPDLQPRYNC